MYFAGAADASPVWGTAFVVLILLARIGHHVFTAMLDALDETAGLQDATDIVLSGTSAGECVGLLNVVSPYSWLWPQEVLGCG